MKQIELCEKCNGPARHCECEGSPRPARPVGKRRQMRMLGQTLNDALTGPGTPRQLTDAETRALRHDNWELRVMLAIAHAGLALYTDDGELTDARVQPHIDYKRDSVAEIERKLRARAYARAHARLAAPQPPNAERSDRP